jgi:uncharacterized protein YggE
MSSPTVEVTGRASVETEPEYAVLTAEFEAGGESAAGAQRRVDDLRESLDRELPDGVGDGDRHVTNRAVGTADEVFDAGVDGPYVATATVELRCEESRADEVATAVTAASGSVTRTEPRVTEARREELREELLTVATENAREQAEHIAAAEGHTVSGLRNVSTEEALGFESIVEEALAAEMSAGVPPGPIEFTASVEATYELAE